jgi:ketosteroid isomerase-like protein
MTSDALTQSNLGEFMLGYGKAWNDHDPDAIAALHTEDTRFCPHGFGEPAEGRAAMRAAAAETFELFPEFATEPHKVLLGDEHWVLEWTVVNGDVRVDCVDVVTIAGGLVKTKDTYFDFAQLGAAMTALTGA